ncbi:MAG TPA: Lrp/AsnC family transcriptional regulator [Haliscomenobacter sp.]|uniref:Lrp/AsnC family transcriptional regulator n=1 Tax=Haliscomenobacter sp. TaxID=2717303 RepID=UPI001DB003B5|nr:Lrp/AsnC family transcriptional regulator [Haliscomenobacter sp.]MBK9489407.1 Lrp/AsnC family transcriptional regulator [Haliscomenobacter sp.]HOY19106.1 Lrp/AsnC family transcriptional regulator [Haliscomenobacter sp.]HPH21806.1 Lrp/AsnC family transcriptional regulator [Haliscomenobacter sp.]
MENTNSNHYQPDEIDQIILQSLQADGRKSFSDLAKEMGMAVSTISKRYMNLVDCGILTIVGRVEPERVGLNAYAAIQVQVDTVANVERVAQELLELPEVSFLALRTGDFQLEINVMCRDNTHLMEILRNQMDKISHVRKYEINMYLKVYKWGRSGRSDVGVSVS